LMDIMEDGATSIVASIVDFNETTKTWGIAAAVPDVSPETAVHLVEVARRGSAKREGNWVARSAAMLAHETLKNDPNDPNFIDRVKELTCKQEYWTLSSVQPVTSGGKVAGFRPQIESNDWQKWSTTEEKSKPQSLLLAPDDANAILHGRAYDLNLLTSNKSFYVSNREKTQAQLKDFFTKAASILREVEMSPQKEQRQKIVSGIASLLEDAVKLQATRSSLQKIQFVDSLQEIQQMSDLAAAKGKLKALIDSGDKFASEHAPMRAPEIAAFCEMNKGTRVPAPMAYYDGKSSAFYIIEDVSGVSRLPDVADDSGRPDPDSKIRLQMNSVLFAPVLAKSSVAVSEMISSQASDPKDTAKIEERLKAFPFPNASFRLVGRDTGNGVEGAFILETERSDR
jgi:hypothetical protein